MGPKRKYDDLARESRAGTSSGDGGGGGGGGGDEASSRLRLSPPRLPLSPPPTSPSRDPRALPTSPPPLQPPRPPPRAALRDTDGGLDNGDLREEENDKVEDDEDEGPYDDYVPKEENDGDWNWEQEEAEYNYGDLEDLVRLLTEVEIRTQYMYKRFIPENRFRKKIITEDSIALQFCWKHVRNLDAEADALQMRALTYALGIPLRVEIVDRKSKKGEPVRVKRLDFFHQSDLSKGPFHLVQSYYSSSTAHKPLERGSDNNLLSSDGAPLLTLLCRHGRCDILYRK